MKLPNRFGLLVVATALAGWFALTCPGRAVAQDKEPPPAKADFAGKLLLVQTAENEVVVLEDVRVKQLGKTHYLTGKIFAANDRVVLPKKGKLWLPTSVVTKMYEFDTVAEFEDFKKLKFYNWR